MRNKWFILILAMICWTVFISPALARNFKCSNVADGFEKNIVDGNGNCPSGGDCYGGECVVYVRLETDIEREACQGPAKDCYSLASNAGYSTGTTPAIGSIMVMGAWSGSSAGHVAIVIELDPEDSSLVKVRDSNWVDTHKIGEHWIDTDKKDKDGNSVFGTFGYIYCEEPEIETKCVGNNCWSPVNAPCEEASAYYDLDGNPQGDGACQEAKAEVVELQAATDPELVVEEKSWSWQIWWNWAKLFWGVLDVFADDVDLNEYAVVTVLRLDDYVGVPIIDEQIGLYDPQTSEVYTVNPTAQSPDADVHITHHHIRPYNKGSWHEKISADLHPGGTFFFHTEARVENRGSQDIEVDIDYCIVTKKDFDIPRDQRKRLDDDQVIIAPGKKENKTLRRSRFTLSENLTSYTITTDDRASFTFPITAKQLAEREITTYFYIEVDIIDGGNDNDVSSEAKSDEFGKLKIHINLPYSKFTPSTISAQAPATINFANQSIGGNLAYHWDFGNGAISTDKDPSHTYTQGGTYNVSLEVTDEEGTDVNNSTIYIGPPPTIKVTNPESTDRWRCDRDSQYKNIRWEYQNFPNRGYVAVYYTYKGNWRTLTSRTPNDGSLRWYMCKTKTKDTWGYVKIQSLEYPNVYGISDRFFIDHARGCD